MDASADTPPALDLSLEAGNASSLRNAISATSRHLGDKEEHPFTTTNNHVETLNSATTNNIGPSKSQEHISIRSKAQRSQPHLMVLIACVSCLLIEILGMSLGLCLIRSYATSRRSRANERVLAASSFVYAESFAHQQLDVLENTRLDRHYIESYEQCIERGLRTAEKVHDQPYFVMFPNCRNHTIDWVTDNCDRLIYTPQVQESSALRRVMNNIRQASLDAFATLKYKVVLLRSWVYSSSTPTSDEQITISEPRPTTSPLNTHLETPLTKVWNLTCDERTRCQLVYSGPTNLDIDAKEMRKIVAKAEKEVLMWNYPFDKIVRGFHYLEAVLFSLQTLLGILIMLSVYLSRPRNGAESVSPPNMGLASFKLRVSNAIDYFAMHDHARLALFSFVESILGALVRCYFEDLYSAFGRMQLPIGLLFFITSAIDGMVFLCTFVPDAGEGVGRFCRATKELYLILQGQELHPVRSPYPPQDTTPTCTDAKPASKIGFHHISPVTPLAEDLHRTHEALQAQRNRDTDSSVGSEHSSAVESESDYNSDVQHASYVDLTGGATPTVSDESEEGEDWAVVHD